MQLIITYNYIMYNYKPITNSHVQQLTVIYSHNHAMILCKKVVGNVR